MKPFVFRGTQLPEHLQKSLEAYVVNGRSTGGFLRAVIDNDLRIACASADEKNVVLIHVIVAYLYNECPTGCWGFTGASKAWLDKKQAERDQS